MGIKQDYKQAYKDRCFLWSIGPAADMTGGYVDQGDLEKLLKTPTMSTALRCLSNQIRFWFESGIEYDPKYKCYSDIVEQYPEVENIKDRYNPGYVKEQYYQ